MSIYPTLTDTQCEVQLPTELASLFINGDWSVVDYIDDEHYETAINNYLHELELDGLDFVDVIDDSSFCEYHDLTEHGVLATDCSTFILDKVN